VVVAAVEAEEEAEEEVVEVEMEAEVEVEVVEEDQEEASCPRRHQPLSLKPLWSRCPGCLLSG
jgi:hypothetical protein